jgi:hypothetical protein
MIQFVNIVELKDGILKANINLNLNHHFLSAVIMEDGIILIYLITIHNS